jgi:hypothetical protein
MNWVALISLKVPLPAGYRLTVLRRDEVAALVAKLRAWYPDIVVGAESGHLRPEFYEAHCAFEGDESADKNLLAVLGKRGDDVAALVTFERDVEARTLTSRMGAVASEHRGSGIAQVGPLLLEAMGRAMGAGLAYYFVTLKSPHQQVLAERCGFQLVGIVPGFDRDMVTAGTVRRVYEGLYAKLLVGSEEVMLPPEGALTPKTQALWSFLFG